MTSRICFYAIDFEGAKSIPSRVGAIESTGIYKTRFWTPSLKAPFPPGRRDPKILMYTPFQALGIFGNGRYHMAMLTTAAGAIAHSSLVMPRFWRFPFMGVNDLQIGATETKLEHRGRGLAVRAIVDIVTRMATPSRKFWYLTEESNSASLSVIRKVGFDFVGFGRLIPRYNMHVLGRYELD